MGMSSGGGGGEDVSDGQKIETRVPGVCAHLLNLGSRKTGARGIRFAPTVLDTLLHPCAPFYGGQDPYTNTQCGLLFVRRFMITTTLLLAP